MVLKRNMARGENEKNEGTRKKNKIELFKYIEEENKGI